MTLPRLLSGLSLLALCGCGPRELVVTMKADNNSGQTGFATITEIGAGLRVVVETSVPDFLSSTGQVAHIHEGNCGEIGRIRAGLVNLKELPDKPGRFGSTSEVATLKFNDFKMGEWAINAHDERDNLVYVSCGQIPKP